MSAFVGRRLEIRVLPRSRRNEVGGERQGRLLVRTTAPPADGRANAKVIELVAEHLGVPTRAVSLLSGHRSRDKVLGISDG